MTIKKTEDKLNSLMERDILMDKNPLVSIIIPNRNHSAYLKQAIESALAQTYTNIEIIISDNCSTDNSLEIAMGYLNRGVIINRNPVNVFGDNYKVLASLASGKYFMILCADDLIKPTFIERSVSIMEQHSNVGYVHCERDYIDENGNIIELDPFFNCSFISPGESMLPVYMLTDVGQAVQGLIRRTIFDAASGYDTETDYLTIERELWFRLSMISDYAYIREKLALLRVHTQSESSNTREYFVHPLSIYVMLKGFIEWAKIKNYPKVLEREKISFTRLALESLTTAINALKAGKISLAKQNILFARILDNSIVENENYKQCLKIIETQNTSTLDESHIKDIRVAFHKRSYDPPENYILL
jgi:glycosyltransferase involved in cell wall biosynthesis